MFSSVLKHKMFNISRYKEVIQKIVSVIENNKDMGGVNKEDMMMSFNNLTQKSKKRY